MVAEATLEAERQDPEHVKRWVVLLDGAETQLDLVEASAAVYGADVTVIFDIIHVVEYVWKAAQVFHREQSPELAHWAWTRVRSIFEGKAARWPRRSGGRQAGRYVRRLPAEIRAVSALRSLLGGGLSHCHRRDRRGVSVPGPRSDGVDRRPLALGRRRGGPEAAGATSKRRLRCVLGLPRKRASTSGTTPGATLTGQHRRSASRSPPALPSTPSTGQVALAVTLAEAHWAADEEEPHPTERPQGMAVTAVVCVGVVRVALALANRHLL